MQQNDKASDTVLEKGGQRETIDNAEQPGRHIEGNIQLIDAHNEIRRVPLPSKSPRDPLNFSLARRIGIFVTVVWFSVMAMSVIGGFGALQPTFFGLYASQGVPIDHIARLLTWPSLFTGIANFGFMPMALVLGRRPVFILAACLLLAASIWAANAGTSFQSHLSARIVLGVAAGATESLLPLIITDMTFVHERSVYFGAYWVGQSVFTNILSLSSSFIAVDLTWPWYYWIFAILSGVGLLLVLLLCPETKFARPAFAVDGEMVHVDEYGMIVTLEQDEIVSGEDDAADKPFTWIRSLTPIEVSTLDRSMFKTVAKCYMGMAYSLLDPAIVWSLGASSLALGITIALSLSFGTVLEEAYHWPAQNTGLIFAGALPACAMAFLCAGWGGDKVNLALARRNKGLHLPEHRLPPLIFPVVTGLAFIVMYGYCAEHAPSSSWFSIVWVVNYIVFYFVSILIVTTTYAVEALTHHAGPAIVMVVGGKNIISFGLSTAVVPASNEGRYIFLCWIFFGVSAAWFLLAIPLYFYMPKFRAWRTARLHKNK